VIAFRDTFLVPPDDERLQIVNGDGAEYSNKLKKASMSAGRRLRPDRLRPQPGQPRVF
jgi:hypothetical protein